MRNRSRWSGAIIALGAGLLLSGCGVSTWYNPVSETPTVSSTELSQKSPSFRDGYNDGCTTAHGEYTKNSDRFNSDSEYHDGWFAGRSACQYK